MDNFYVFYYNKLLTALLILDYITYMNFTIKHIVGINSFLTKKDFYPSPLRPFWAK